MTNKYELSSKFIGRFKIYSNKVNERIYDNVKFRMSRLEADKLRHEIIQRNGKTIIDNKLKKHIKSTCKQRFGSTGFWHWPALYTEMRGEFHEGWLPDDFYRFRLLPEWNLFEEISEFKTFDYQIFGDFAVEPILIYIRGKFFKSNFDFLSTNNVKSYLTNCCDEVVIKPDRGRSGIGSKFCHVNNFKVEDFNPNESYIIQPVLRQHKKLDELSSDSVNSIRIVTFMNENAKIRLINAKQKFSAEGSRFDHLKSGGLLLKLDSNGIAVSDAIGKFGTKVVKKHPLHGFEFKSFEVPRFKSALNKCIAAHSKFPYTKIIGWDVAIDESGTPKLLEWNARHPGMWLDEALFGPLWNEHELSVKIR